MTDVKHTPGPWRIDPGFCCDVQTADAALEIASTSEDTLHAGRKPPSDEQRANARLIAAAPCMLAALEAMLVGSKYRETTIGGRALTGWATIRMPNEDALNLARAAIAKARGHD